jgi:hypothetical protein
MGPEFSYVLPSMLTHRSTRQSEAGKGIEEVRLVCLELESVRKQGSSIDYQEMALTDKNQVS